MSVENCAMLCARDWRPEPMLSAIPEKRLPTPLIMESKIVFDDTSSKIYWLAKVPLIIFPAVVILCKKKQFHYL